MHKFLGIPNVSNLFFLSLLMASSHAAAAYKVLDDDLSTQPAAAISEAAPAPAAYQNIEIPFHAKRFQLGARGNKTLESGLAAAKSAQHIIIIGRGDRANDDVLAGQRADMIKSLLIKKGITASLIETRTDPEAIKDKSPDIFLSTIKLESKSNVPMIAQQRTAYIVAKNTDDDSGIVPTNSPKEIVKNTSQGTGNGNAKYWLLQSRLSLKENLTAWCKEMSWNEPAWLIEDPYVIEKDKKVYGTFVEVVSAVAKPLVGIDVIIDKKTKTVIVKESAH